MRFFFIKNSTKRHELSVQNEEFNQVQNISSSWFIFSVRRGWISVLVSPWKFLRHWLSYLQWKMYHVHMQAHYVMFSKIYHFCNTISATLLSTDHSFLRLVSLSILQPTMRSDTPSNDLSDHSLNTHHISSTPVCPSVSQ